MKLDELNTYCLSLERRQDRREKVEPNIRKVGIDFKWAWAIDGYKLEYDPESIPHPYMRDRPGTVGICLSYKAMFEKAKENKLPHIFILEDDVVFSDDFSDKNQDFLHNVPQDWDMIYLGGNHLDHHPIKINEHVSKCVSTRSSHAVIYKDTCYDYFINILGKMINPLDEVFAKAQRDRDVVAYVPDPPLAWQFDGHSDIEDRYANYAFLEVFDEEDYINDRAVKNYPMRNFTDSE